MAQNKKSPYRSPGSSSNGRAFDIKPPKRKQPAFPAVGMTLSTYAGPKPTSSKASRTPKAAPLHQPSRFKRLKSKFTRKRVIMFFAIILLAGVAWLGFKVLYNAHRIFGGGVFSVLSNDKLDGENEGRVNILVAGNSADNPGHQGGRLTDSIMVLSIDTKNKTGFMMSIPRDLYIKVPDYSRQKINAIYPAGEDNDFRENGYADGGMGLLQKTIEENIGIKTHYYALVNYKAVKDAVDAVGGVSFTVQSSDKRGIYDSSKDYTTNTALVRLSNGTHKLNGQQALNLARARGEGRGSYGYANSDFTRTENQRKLMLALRSKATSAGVLTNPIKLGSLFDSIGGNVDTDLDLGNVRRLYDITKDIEGGAIQSVGLNDADGENLLGNYRTPRGESALIPAAGVDDYSDIQRYIRRLTSTNLVVRENADIVLLNGTTKSGLAAREADLLSNKNIRVDSKADADNEDYAVTQIVDLSGGKKAATLSALKKAYTGSSVTTTNPFGTKYDADFIVILGADRVPSTSNAN